MLEIYRSTMYERVSEMRLESTTRGCAMWHQARLSDALLMPDREELHMDVYRTLNLAVPQLLFTVLHQAGPTVSEEEFTGIG